MCSQINLYAQPDKVLDKLVLAHGKSVFFQLGVGGSELLPEGKDGVEKDVVYCLRPDYTRPRPLLDIAGKVSARVPP